jgi:hypothetical protein
MQVCKLFSNCGKEYFDGTLICQIGLKSLCLNPNSLNLFDGFLSILLGSPIMNCHIPSLARKLQSNFPTQALGSARH